MQVLAQSRETFRGNNNKKRSAIKVRLRDEEIIDDLAEVENMPRFIHPNLVNYRRCWTEEVANSQTNFRVDQMPFLLIQMELCDRGSRDDAIKEGVFFGRSPKV